MSFSLSKILETGMNVSKDKDRFRIIKNEGFPYQCLIRKYIRSNTLLNTWEKATLYKFS